MRLDGTAGDIRYRVCGGRVVVDRIRCGTGGDILDQTALNVEDTRVGDRVGSVAAGIISVSAVDPGVGRTGDQFTRSLSAAVLDRQRSFICDECGGRALSGSSDDLKSVIRKSSKHIHSLMEGKKFPFVDSEIRRIYQKFIDQTGPFIESYQPKNK